MSSLLIQFKHFALRSIITGCTAMLMLNVSAQAQLMQEPEVEEYPYPELIHDAPVVVDLLPFWAWVLIGMAGSSLVVLILWLLFRGGAVHTPRQPDPKKIALQKLQTLQDNVEAVGVSESAHQVSLIIREYQQGVYLVPAPFRTSEELYQSGPRQTHEHARVRFSKIADFLDKLAFAPQPASAFEVKKLIEEAIITVENNTPPPVLLLGAKSDAAFNSGSGFTPSSTSTSRSTATPPMLPPQVLTHAEASEGSESDAVTVPEAEAPAAVRTESNEQTPNRKF